MKQREIESNNNRLAEHKATRVRVYVLYIKQTECVITGHSRNQQKQKRAQSTRIIRCEQFPVNTLNVCATRFPN